MDLLRPTSGQGGKVTKGGRDSEREGAGGGVQEREREGGRQGPQGGREGVGGLQDPAHPSSLNHTKMNSSSEI